MCLVFPGRGGGPGGRGGRGGGPGGGKHSILTIVNCNFEICLNTIFILLLLYHLKKGLLYKEIVVIPSFFNHCFIISKKRVKLQ